MTAPLLRPVASPAASPRSLARVKTEAAEKERNEARVLGERPAPRFCSNENSAQPSISDERLTHGWAE
jgi:hypothetical protein